jgi:hypothetical protein
LQVTLIFVTPVGMVNVPDAAIKTVLLKPPAAGALETQAEPFDVKTLPLVLGDVNPVPPLATGNVPETAAVKLACPLVFTLLANWLKLNACVILSPYTAP